jgi:hypothetical protein
LSILVGRILGAIRLGRITAVGPNIQLVRLYTGNLTATEAAQVNAWQTQLQQIVRQAVQQVDAGLGTTRWAQIYGGQGPLAGTALARGNAIHYEAFQMIRSAQFQNAPNILLNRGVARSLLGFPNSFGKVRPDIRFPLANGREVVFDITTFGQIGHSAHYGSRSWVEAVIEILY